MVLNHFCLDEDGRAFTSLISYPSHVRLMHRLHFGFPLWDPKELGRDAQENNRWRMGETYSSHLTLRFLPDLLAAPAMKN